MYCVVFVVGLSATATAQNEIIGTVTESDGNSFTVKCDKCDLLPVAKDTCEVSKDISGSKNPFGITIQSGWLSVADAFFVYKKGNFIHFSIIRETSNIVINGKKKDHFEKGKKMKIVWQ